MRTQRLEERIETTRNTRKKKIIMKGTKDNEEKVMEGRRTGCEVVGRREKEQYLDAGTSIRTDE